MKQLNEAILNKAKNTIQNFGHKFGISGINSEFLNETKKKKNLATLVHCKLISILKTYVRFCLVMVFLWNFDQWK